MNKPINLDEMTVSELRCLVKNEQLPHQLERYARYAILHAEAWEDGAEEAAGYYVEQCDKIYANLPESLRW